MEACKDEIIKAIQKGPSKDKIDELIENHEEAMDDLVTMNSLFTVAVFVGLAFATPGQRSLENRDECNADVNAAKRQIIFEVISFALFLLSSLVAKSLKLHLNVYKKDYFKKPCFRLFKGVTLYICILASFAGCFFLMLSMVDVLQIRLGKLTCGTNYTLTAAVLLIVFVSLALIFYVSCALFAIRKSMGKLEKRVCEAGKEKPQRDKF